MVNYGLMVGGFLMVGMGFTVSWKLDWPEVHYKIKWPMSYMYSSLVWCSLIVSAGTIFLMSLSLINFQVESVICSSMGFLSSGFSSSMVLLTLWVYILSMLVSDKASKKTKNMNYFSLMGVLMLVCCIFFKVSDFFFLYLFFEGVLVPIIFMILGWGQQPERFEAGLYMLIYTITGSLPLLLCLLWIWSLNLSSFFMLTFKGEGFSESWLIMSMLSLAFCIKMPLFGVHGWLPKAHVEASVAGSMMLAGVLLKMGVYGLVMFFWFIEMSYSWVFDFLMILGVMGSVISGFICLYQSDMKALIAYSSVGHMCFLLVGLMSMGWVGWEGVILMTLSHGICSPWLFFLANYLSEVYGTRSLYLLKGVLLVSPAYCFLLFIGVSSNMAVPPCVALIAELSLFISGTFYSFFLVLPMMVLCFFAAAYSLGLYSMISHGSKMSKVKMWKAIKSRCLLGSLMCSIPLMFGVFIVDIFSM